MINRHKTIDTFHLREERREFAASDSGLKSCSASVYNIRKAKEIVKSILAWLIHGHSNGHEHNGY